VRSIYNSLGLLGVYGAFRSLVFDSILHFFFILYITSHYIFCAGFHSPGYYFPVFLFFCGPLVYYDGVLDEMNTYDDSDGFCVLFLFERGGGGGREKKRERKDNVQ
jgi:hypothetical protein